MTRALEFWQFLYCLTDSCLWIYLFIMWRLFNLPCHCKHTSNKYLYTFQHVPLTVLSVPTLRCAWIALTDTMWTMAIVQVGKSLPKIIVCYIVVTEAHIGYIDIYIYIYIYILIIVKVLIKMWFHFNFICSVMLTKYSHYRTNVILLQMTVWTATMHRRAQNTVHGHYIGNGTYTSK